TPRPEALEGIGRILCRVRRPCSGRGGQRRLRRAARRVNGWKRAGNQSHLQTAKGVLLYCAGTKHDTLFEAAAAMREPVLQAPIDNADDDDRMLRPQRMRDMVGQREVAERLEIAVDAARKRSECLGHIL